MSDDSHSARIALQLLLAVGLLTVGVTGAATATTLDASTPADLDDSLLSHGDDTTCVLEGHHFQAGCYEVESDDGETRVCAGTGPDMTCVSVEE